jgi:hypothetical protein
MTEKQLGITKCELMETKIFAEVVSHNYLY